MAEQTPEMARPVVADRIGEGTFDVDVAARETELGPIASRLMVPAVSRLAASFRLRRLPEGMFAADGRLEAALTRECVVSLEPFEEQVAEAFSLVFVPASQLVEDDDPEAPDQLPYTDGVLDLGEAAVEQLALAMEPFPRKPGAPTGPEAQTGSVPAGQGGGTVRPFAGLAAKLRRDG